MGASGTLNDDATVCEALLFADLVVGPACRVQLRQDVSTASIGLGERRHCLDVWLNPLAIRRRGEFSGEHRSAPMIAEKDFGCSANVGMCTGFHGMRAVKVFGQKIEDQRYSPHPAALTCLAFALTRPTRMIGW